METEDVKGRKGGFWIKQPVTEKKRKMWQQDFSSSCALSFGLSSKVRGRIGKEKTGCIDECQLKVERGDNERVGMKDYFLLHSLPTDSCQSILEKEGIQDLTDLSFFQSESLRCLLLIFINFLLFPPSPSPSFINVCVTQDREENENQSFLRKDPRFRLTKGSEGEPKRGNPTTQCPNRGGTVTNISLHNFLFFFVSIPSFWLVIFLRPSVHLFLLHLSTSFGMIIFSFSLSAQVVRLSTVSICRRVMRG